MPTMEEEMLLINSEEPLPQAFSSGRSSSLVLTRRRRLEFGRRK